MAGSLPVLTFLVAGAVLRAPCHFIWHNAPVASRPPLDYKAPLILIVCRRIVIMPSIWLDMTDKLPNYALLGDVIRTFRLQRGLSQESLAERAALHRTYIGSVERGERNPSFQSLSRIVDALGISWTEFGQAIDRAAGGTDR
jgi:DNA-binding XRE family transcriptional regulator